MADILPKEHDFWKAVFEVGWNVSELNDFYYIETPILEEAALFERGVGEATDIVTKGRHDPCVGIRGAPVVEAMMALVLADHKLLHRAQCG